MKSAAWHAHELRRAKKGLRGLRFGGILIIVVGVLVDWLWWRHAFPVAVWFLALYVWGLVLPVIERVAYHEAWLEAWREAWQG